MERLVKFDIKFRFSSCVLTVEIDCAADTDERFKLGLAVKAAVASGAYLADAYLAGANLAGANLAGANLAGAYLADAYLADANLAGANLAGAYLAGANLAGANLAGANLADANLAGAYLAGAYLADAYLAGANLAGANLAGAKWRDGIVLKRAPLYLSGLRWSVVILDDHMQIGCELHSIAEWSAFDDRRIANMDGRDALRFWRAHKDALLALAKSDGRGVEPPASDAPAEAVEADAP
jgi:hypothetical protein